MKKRVLYIIGVLLSLHLLVNAQVESKIDATNSEFRLKLQQFVNKNINDESFVKHTGYNKKDSTVVDSFVLNTKQKQLLVFLDSRLRYAPIRPKTIEYLQHSITQVIKGEMGDYKVCFYTDGVEISQFIPNYYRQKNRDIDKSRTFKKLKRKEEPLVKSLWKPYPNSDLLLYNTNIALWHSHGWYYEPTLHRWEWQRARLFKTVEDLYPMVYTLQGLVPMLENAGANVFLPRERHWQLNEAIVDNDGSTGKSIYHENGVDVLSTDTGFAIGQLPYVNENPFRLGTCVTLNADKNSGGTVEYIPDIPESGEYPVFVSYKSSKQHINDARYEVFHEAGSSVFSVNQTMGGGTWVYLGAFYFNKGINPQNGKVVLSSESKTGDFISADAVRFGIGMGNIARNGLVSQRPKYMEAARYYLQYAGFPDTIIWKLNTQEEDDYADDYQSRGEWVSYLKGAPSGPTKNRQEKGLGIPIDLAFAFHTDAGITNSDTVIGTLGIYSTKKKEKDFPNGLSKMASRDLTDLIQTQIVEDIRAKYDKAWVRRPMWDRGYSEAFRPTVPTMLLELFSHQNFIDARFGDDPNFRFDVSRAIYKGMLKFLSSLYGIDYVVQPLPVNHFSAHFNKSGFIELNWQQQLDVLEPTAKAESFIVYTKINGGGYDNGVEVKNNSYSIENVMPDSVYSFKIAALNKGGESFKSEELSICKVSQSKGTVLIINAFDRVGGAAWFNEPNMAGFLDMVDQGVPYMLDLHTVGSQYDFSKNSPWLDDDSPGHGASYADLEDKVIPGNTFDFSYTHGTAIKNAGYSFVSVSDESMDRPWVSMGDYPIIDLLAGEEKTTYRPKNDSVPYYQLMTEKMVDSLDNYLRNGGSLFMSGAHIATDMHMNQQDSLAGRIFKYKWRTSNASRKGEFYFMDEQFFNTDEKFVFNTKVHPRIYTVEGADALEPADSTAQTIIRYSENNMSAGVGYKGTYSLVAIGFPFETIMAPQRDAIMKKVLEYLEK